MTTSYLYMNASDEFSYFGSFSGAICSDDQIDLSGPLENKPMIMIGAGEEDFGGMPSLSSLPIFASDITILYFHDNKLLFFSR